MANTSAVSENRRKPRRMRHRRWSENEKARPHHSEEGAHSDEDGPRSRAGHRDDVVRVGGVPHPEKESEGEDRYEAHGSPAGDIGIVARLGWSFA
jgi:hypothetical protein